MQPTILCYSMYEYIYIVKYIINAHKDHNTIFLFFSTIYMYIYIYIHVYIYILKLDEAHCADIFLDCLSRQRSKANIAPHFANVHLHVAVSYQIAGKYLLSHVSKRLWSSNEICLLEMLPDVVTNWGYCSSYSRDRHYLLESK